MHAANGGGKATDAMRVKLPAPMAILFLFVVAGLVSHVRFTGVPASILPLCSVLFCTIVQVLIWGGFFAVYV